MGKMLKAVKFPVAVLVLCALISAGWARPAKADPHGIFFTVIGQQQLFFNVLAALNQADYVETVQLRQQLAAKRDAVLNDPQGRLEATNTDLSDVLTRSVTLDGNDAEEARILREIANEDSRRRNDEALKAILCQIAFGVERCVQEGRDPAEVAREKAKTFVTDSEKRNHLTLWAALGTAMSNFNPGSSDQANRREIAENDGYLDGQWAGSYPFSSSLANLDDVATDSQKERIVDNLRAGALAPYVAEGVVDASWLDLVSFNGEGEAELNISQTASAEEKRDAIFSVAHGAISLGNRIDEVVANEVGGALAFLDAQESDGFLARSKPIYPTGKVNGRDVIGPIRGEIEVPAEARAAAAEQLAAGLVAAESNAQFQPPEAGTTGGTQLVLDESRLTSSRVTGPQLIDEDATAVTQRQNVRFHADRSAWPEDQPFPAAYLDSQNVLCAFGLCSRGNGLGVSAQEVINKNAGAILGDING